MFVCFLFFWGGRGGAGGLIPRRKGPDSYPVAFRRHTKDCGEDGGKELLVTTNMITKFFRCSNHNVDAE